MSVLFQGLGNPPAMLSGPRLARLSSQTLASSVREALNVSFFSCEVAIDASGHLAAVAEDLSLGFTP